MEARRLGLVLPILFEFAMMSCGAKSGPDQLKVTAPASYSGPISIRPCVTGAPADSISLDQSGSGQTSVCPVSQGVQLIVTRGTQTDHVSARVVQTGDGIATAINAELR
jgi:hypothetical protein